MAQRGLHRGLELRLEALGNRIDALRHAMQQAQDAEKLEQFGELEELKKRYEALADRLHALNEEGPGFRQNLKAELEKMADDLSCLIEDFVMKLDAKYLGGRPPLAERKW